MKLNVTLPAHNEAVQLASSVRRVAEFLAGLPQVQWEIVIAENGSTDGTRALAEALAKEVQESRGRSQEPVASGWNSEAGSQETDAGSQKPEVRTQKSADGSLRTEQAIALRVVHLDQAGRGAALRAAWLGSDADVVSYMDVDLSTDLACLPALLEPLRRDKADVAIGSRLLPGSRTTRGWKRECLSRGYNRLLHAALGLRVADAQCGFKALTRRAAQALLPRVRDEGWFFDTELLWRAQRGGWRIAEVPVCWVDDPGTTVRLLSTIWRDLRGVWRLRREPGGKE